MKETVRQFIEMMLSEYHRRDTDYAISPTEPAVFNEIMQTPEYQALKALIENASASTNNVSASTGIDGWIPHNSGECPVDRDMVIQTRLTGWNKEKVFTGKAGQATWHSGYDLSVSVHSYRLPIEYVNKNRKREEKKRKIISLKKAANLYLKGGARG